MMYYYLAGIGGFVLLTITTIIVTKSNKKSKIKKQFNNLKNKLETLNNSNIPNKLEKIKTMSENNPEYVDSYELFSSEYKNAVDDYSYELEQDLNRIDCLFAEKDYKSIKEELQKLEKWINDYENALNSVDSKINEITNEEEEMRKVVVPLKEEFRNLKNKFSEHKDELSECAENFENKLNELENTIVEMDNKLENGYYKETQELINIINKEIEFYNEHLDKMPQIVSFSLQVLPNRLETTMNKYQKMKEDGYPLFGIKLTNIVEHIKISLDEIKNRFQEFSYDGINEQIKEVAYEIDNLNDLLEKEISSKEKFLSRIDNVYANTNSINKKYLKAKRDNASIKDIYLIDEAKNTMLNELEMNIQTLNRIKLQLDAFVHSATKQPYSMLTTKMEEIDEFNTEIEEKLDNYINYTYSLKEDSEQAYDKVNDYGVEISKLYSEIVALNHQILKNQYVQRYEDVCVMIDNLSRLLKTKPIDVNTVNDETKNLTNAAEVLIKDMKESLTIYDMAENIIVFTNQYRSSFSSVNEALNRAQVHFESAEFTIAIDVASDALQEVHPAAYEEMMKKKGYNNE